MTHPNDLARDLRLAIARGVAARDWELGPEYGPYDPANPGNNRDPSMSSVTAFPIFGRPPTYLSEISFIANAIPRSNYPLDTVQVYLGMSRQLTQMEADYLNGATP